MRSPAEHPKPSVGRCPVTGWSSWCPQELPCRPEKSPLAGPDRASSSMGCATGSRDPVRNGKPEMNRPSEANLRSRRSQEVHHGRHTCSRPPQRRGESLGCRRRRWLPELLLALEWAATEAGFETPHCRWFMWTHTAASSFGCLRDFTEEERAILDSAVARARQQEPERSSPVAKPLNISLATRAARSLIHRTRRQRRLGRRRVGHMSPYALHGRSGQRFASTAPVATSRCWQSLGPHWQRRMFSEGSHEPGRSRFSSGIKPRLRTAPWDS